MDALRALLARLPRGPLVIGWVAVLTVLLGVVYGTGSVGFDGGYSLIWGRELLNGEIPEFRRGPTPHPLAYAIGAPMSLLGDDAIFATGVLSLVSLAAVGVAAFLLGARLFTAPVGALFALILLTRPALVSVALQAYIDIPFLALVIGAAAIEARQPRRGYPVLALLGVAGLLRPEAWLLSLAYVVYLRATERDRFTSVALIIAGLAAPVIWLASDLVITGDPLWSFSRTRVVAAELGRPRTLGEALAGGPATLGDILHLHLMLAGLGGILVGVRLLYRQSLLPTAVLVLGLLPFLVLGTAGLPTLPRYLVLPAAMLGLFAGVAVLGWRQLQRTAEARRIWKGAAVIAGAVILSLLPHERRQLRMAVSESEARHVVQQDLVTIVSSREMGVWRSRCSGLYISSDLHRPTAAHVLERTPSTIRLRGLDSPDPVLAVIQGIKGLPPGFRLVARRGEWTLWERC